MTKFTYILGTGQMKRTRWDDQVKSIKKTKFSYILEADHEDGMG